MRLDIAKYLFDVREAARSLDRFLHGRSWADYSGDDLLRSAVERKLEIIGEALAQLARRDPSVAETIGEYRRIIAFRNILIHGYAEVDHRLVWDIVQSRLPPLLAQVDTLLAAFDAAS